ncbi:hypothetical protein KY285_004969 [Solanum tuberosum]|nr:hypothetical protein KY289_005429 [Solanum tuberosum]KAH0751821.1 hypothetical protein KY285_004969 [Solanum tuberosum]
MDDLTYYNINYWCKVYFNTEVKCDSVDNNSECFNAWILAARHKTIITMLEEIRVKMMTIMTNLREFPSTWKCNFSPMVLKVLKENISRSIDCTIEFNGVVGFEVKEGLGQPKMDIARRTCICRVWQLRGIQYTHDMAALYFTKDVTVSTNPTISPPEITNISGRLSKARRKEARETKKSWNLPRTGLAMTCSICHVRSHNKRGCPQREGVESSTRHSAPSPTASVRVEPLGSGRGRGKQKKTPSAPSEGEPPLKRGRGRQKKTSPAAPSAHLLPTTPIDFPASSSATPNYHA